MIQFIINNKPVNTGHNPNTPLLEFIRYNLNLKGTKTGCNEGDCGACTVLIGELQNGGNIKYQSQTSCLTPLGNVHGKHVVTVEGISPAKSPQQLQNRPLSPVQEAMCNNYATQCGFCTPGFVMSMTGHCLSEQPNTGANLKVAIDGNICRCTGYHSIMRACKELEARFPEKTAFGSPVEFAVENNIVPEYFKNIPGVIGALHGQLKKLNGIGQPVGGGTDIYVQKHDTVKRTSLDFAGLHNIPAIEISNGKVVMSSATTVTHLREHEGFNRLFPFFIKHSKLVSSTQIRNMATIAGNFINASPIGDFTAFFLALNATVVFDSDRRIALNKLYLGYKKLDKSAEERIAAIEFPVPSSHSFFNFEKVSKRKHLDIASANSACLMVVEDMVITDICISAGGVGPTPMVLNKTCAFLKDKALTDAVIDEALVITQSEIAPISDARGTEQYKRLLINQLIKAHFIEYRKR